MRFLVLAWGKWEMAKFIDEGGKGTILPTEVGVLIVEGYKFQSDILRNALIGAGVAFDRILEARDVASALDALKDTVPDVVITELDLPDGQGETLVREIRQRKITAPILAVTSQGDGERVRGALAAGVSDYLLKPVSNAQITKRIARHLKLAAWSAPLTEGPGRPSKVIIGR